MPDFFKKNFVHALCLLWILFGFVSCKHDRLERLRKEIENKKKKIKVLKEEISVLRKELKIFWRRSLKYRIPNVVSLDNGKQVHLKYIKEGRWDLYHSKAGKGSHFELYLFDTFGINIYRKYHKGNKNHKYTLTLDSVHQPKFFLIRWGKM